MGDDSVRKHINGSQGVTVSESSGKLRTFSRRQPGNGSVDERSRQKVPKKKVKVASYYPGVVSYQRPPHSTDKLGIKTVKVPKKPVSKGTKHGSRKTRLKPMARTLLYAVRLLIVGVGIGSIIGTALSIIEPGNKVAKNTVNEVATNVQNRGNSLFLSQEIARLKSSLYNLYSSQTNLKPGVFLVDLDTGEYVNINGYGTFSAASTIKIPILIAFFQDVDAGKVRLDEMLSITSDAVAGGSGSMQYQQVGTQYRALEVATEMMVNSDNTATNMLIARLGGIEALNRRFQSWGLMATAIRSPLPDLSGTNTTTPWDLSNLMAMLNNGGIVNVRSRDLILDIMSRNQRNHLLPSGLGAGARIYHKTGDIATMLADVGLIDVPTGKRYIAAVMVQRPQNDVAADSLITNISRVVYGQFSQGANPNPPLTPQTPSNVNLNNNYSVINVPQGANPAPFTNPNPQYFPPR